MFLVFFWNFLKFFWKVFEIIFCQFRCKFLCKKNRDFRKNIKKNSNFLEFHRIFVFFLWNFWFSENFLGFVKHGRNPWRTDTFCKKSTEKGLFKKVVKSCLRILLAKLYHRWNGKKWAKMKKCMIFYSVFPRKKKDLKRLKNVQKC